MTHFIPRADAVWHNGRRIVPTIWGEPEGNTRYVKSWTDFRDAGGLVTFNEDQTEIYLTLPEGCKFSIGFNTAER